MIWRFVVLISCLEICSVALDVPKETSPVPIIPCRGSITNNSTTHSSVSIANTNINDRNYANVSHPTTSDLCHNTYSRRRKILQSLQNHWSDWNQSHSYADPKEKPPSDLTDMVSYSSKHTTSGMNAVSNILLWTSIYLVGFQSIQTVWVDQNLSLLEIATKLLSKESARAMKTIRQIIDHHDHGVVDVFANFPTRDLMASILALSRLQRAVEYHATVSSTRSIGSNSSKYHSSQSNRMNRFLDLYQEKELMSDLAHYSKFAHAAYGWKFGLLSGRLHFSDKRMLIRKTGLPESNIICANWRSKTHLPAHFLVRDTERKKIVLSIRGTCSPRDILTDLCCSAEDFNVGDQQGSYFPRISKYRARAHHGMLESARSVASMCRKWIATELAMHPDYQLVIVGHSLGGAVAAILACLWFDTFPGVKVYAFGCPCVGPLGVLPTTMTDSIISIVGENDPFSRLSLGHLADASVVLAQLCENKELRESILNRTKVEVEDMDESCLVWCDETMKFLEQFQTAEKLYPPGRILYMRGNLFGGINDISLSEVNSSLFSQLKFHRRMFDISLHIPHRYEIILCRIWNHVKSKV